MLLIGLTGIVSAGVSIYQGLSGGDGDKYAGQQGTDLVYTASEVAQAFTRAPGIRQEIVSIMRTDPDVRGEVERRFGTVSGVVSDNLTLARAALHEASLPGRDINPGEQRIRNLVEQMMGSVLTSGSTQQSLTGRVSDFFGEVEEFGREGQAAVTGAQAGVATERARQSAAGFGGNIAPLALAALAGFLIFRS